MHFQNGNGKNEVQLLFSLFWKQFLLYFKNNKNGFINLCFRFYLTLMHSLHFTMLPSRHCWSLSIVWSLSLDDRRHWSFDVLPLVQCTLSLSLTCRHWPFATTISSSSLSQDLDILWRWSSPKIVACPCHMFVFCVLGFCILRVWIRIFCD